MKKAIFDCDNIFGVKDCDVGGGLTLIYLLGNKETQFLGITSTHEDSSLDVVQAVNLRMLEELGHRDIPVRRGGEERSCYQSEVTVSLAEMTDRHPGELSILVAGSLINLRGIYERDSHFFEKVEEIVLMGGITSPLVFEKKMMEELNSSCDLPTAKTVLTKGRNVFVVTGNNYLKILFTKQEYRERLSGMENRAAAYIMEKTDDQLRYNDEGRGIHGLYNWDVMAVAYLMHPEPSAGNVKGLCVSNQDLETGYLRVEEDEMDGGWRAGIKAGMEAGMRDAMRGAMRDGTRSRTADGRCICNLPLIRDGAVSKDNIYRNWLDVTGVLADV